MDWNEIQTGKVNCFYPGDFCYFNKHWKDVGLLKYLKVSHRENKKTERWKNHLSIVRQAGIPTDRRPTVITFLDFEYDGFIEIRVGEHKKVGPPQTTISIRQVEGLTVWVGDNPVEGCISIQPKEVFSLLESENPLESIYIEAEKIDPDLLKDIEIDSSIEINYIK